jgi:hypothetical protein
VELKNVIDSLYNEWKNNYKDKVNILEENQVFFELIKHIKNQCVI